MSLPSEIVSKLQSFIDNWTKGIQEIADTLFPAEDDNSDKPILMTDCVHATVLFCPTLKYTTAEAAYTGDGCVFKSDIYLSNNNLSFNVGNYIGMTYDVSWAKSTALKNSNNTTIFFDLNHDGDLSAALSTNGFEIKLYYDGAYHPTDIRFKIEAPVTDRKLNLYLSRVNMGADGIVDYSVNNEIVSWTPNRDIKPQSSGQVFYSLKAYPFISNVKNTNNINNWINNNGATHNYTTTYTTPQGNNIMVYYGDNYIITHVVNDEPVSYNDVRNALNIAVEQINDDNDTDIKVPTYNENKYGDNMDKNHEIDMPVSKYSTASGMVYYYQLEPDDVWKVRDGLNTINLDPDVLKDVTRNLISYKLFAFDKTVLMDEHTPVIVHIGGREIKYNDKSIPAEYVKTVKNINLGAININRIYHDYRDFSPYVKLELFVPFCGWTSLPSWCMDKTITGTMFIDLMNGSCKAVIKANSTVVCEMGGACAYDVPFVADSTGAKASSMLAKVATTAGAVASGNPLAIATSGISLAATMNDNYTRMMGVCGDGSNINGLDRMYVKITRVSWTNPFQIERPDIYKHTYGIPCGKSLTLSEGDGYTQIMDANITGAMTDREKQMIIDGFRHGLIL